MNKKVFNENSTAKIDYGLIGESLHMDVIRTQIQGIAPTDRRVIISGETGTGKEIIATGIHNYSKRKAKPFIPFNCTRGTESLIESELFGYEKGAFTGADKQKKGQFELADGGTLFLDEIGDMPLGTQAKILRTVEDGVVYRVGGIKPINVDVRVICASNKKLDELIKNGSFREDLYWRLNQYIINTCSLQERKEDIMPLTAHFMKIILEKSGEKAVVTKMFLDFLLAYRWAGNVRELENVIRTILEVKLNQEKPRNNAIMIVDSNTIPIYIKQEVTPFIVVANPDNALLAFPMSEPIVVSIKNDYKDLIDENPIDSYMLSLKNEYADVNIIQIDQIEFYWSNIANIRYSVSNKNISLYEMRKKHFKCFASTCDNIKTAAGEFEKCVNEYCMNLKNNNKTIEEAAKRSGYSTNTFKDKLKQRKSVGKMP